MGGTVYLLLSTILLVIETVLQLCVISTHSLDEHEGIFMSLLALVVGPIIIVNIVSAVKVILTNDFSGKKCGRVVCIGFHSVQLGFLWRAFKLLVLFDSGDWIDFVNMRLFHSGFQSLPVAAVLCYDMLRTESKRSLDIVTVVFSLISASLGFVLHRTQDLLYTKDDDRENDYELSSATATLASRARTSIGVAFLAFSTMLVLSSRCLSIALFSASESFWIFPPLTLHFIVHFFIELCKPSARDTAIVFRLTTAFYLSVVNVFDLVGKGYSGVQCVFVLFYTAMLIENLTFSFYWMLTANLGEQFKLFLVLIILMCFIVGLIVKFASCGCIFNVQSDILSDAFNNPELGDIKDKHKKPLATDIDYDTNIIREGVDFEIHDLDEDVVDATAITVDNITDPDLSGMSPHFQRAQRPGRDYDNPAFVHSQGNLSIHSRVTNGSNKRSVGSNKYSKTSQELSGGSKSSGSKQRTPKISAKIEQSEIQSQSGIEMQNVSSANHSRNNSNIIDISQVPTVQNARKEDKPTIVVSDTSKYGSLTRDASQNKHNVTKISNGNLTLASSHSKYSRNTHTLHGTLNGSVQNYGYNGFDNPYREAMSRSKPRFSHHRHHHDHVYRNQYHRRVSSQMDYSLDSSELYPSVTSDSSSVSTYTERNERFQRRGAKNRLDYRTRYRRPRSQDGYSSDVSNSDYMSFNDYSMGDSSTWTESTESSSDEAVTWPPSHTANLLKNYNIPDKESSTDNILHWLNTMEHDASQHDMSFSTLHEPSLASDTDISLSAMQTFEVKKEKRKFRKLISKPKGLLLKFSSLNYKGKEKDFQNRQFPLKTTKGNTEGKTDTKGLPLADLEHEHKVTNPPSAFPLPGDIVQESIV